MLKLTEAQADEIRSVREDLEEAGFKNVVLKLHPTYERIGSKQEPLSWQFWPRIRATISFDVPAEPAESGKAGSEEAKR